MESIFADRWVCGAPARDGDVLAQDALDRLVGDVLAQEALSRLVLETK